MTRAKGSIYATKSFKALDRRFISFDEDDEEDEIRAKGEEQLKALVAEIKRQGMVPMFDLVLNHVAIDFKPDGDFPAEWLVYTGGFADTKEFVYSSKEAVDAIVEKVWRPYIDKYIDEYGFAGVRIDAVQLLSLNENMVYLRERIYEILAEKLGHPIIFEEQLYSTMSVSEVNADLKTDATHATHTTTSLFYHPARRYDGTKWVRAGISHGIKDEVSTKQSSIFETKSGVVRDYQIGGTINFSGNHDELPLAAKVLHEMAFEQLGHNPKFAVLREAYDRLTSQRFRSSRSLAVCQETADRIIFCIAMEIHENPSQFGFDRNHIALRLREKMAICALTGGGGWYCLSGDERGDIKEKIVFAPHSLEESDSEDEEDDDRLDFGYESFISRLAIFDPRYIAELRRNGFTKEVTLEAVEDFEDDGFKSPLKKQIEDEMKSQILFKNAKHLTRRDHELCNFGDGICGEYDLRGDITEINQILAKMPVGKAGFWSEVLFLEHKPDLLIVVRTNGSEFKIPDNGEIKSSCDLVVVNLDKSQVVQINDDDLHAIYMAFEDRFGAPYDGSYNHIRKANLHLGEKIENVSSKEAVKYPSKLAKVLSHNTALSSGSFHERFG